MQRFSISTWTSRQLHLLVIVLVLNGPLTACGVARSTPQQSGGFQGETSSEISDLGDDGQLPPASIAKPTIPPPPTPTPSPIPTNTLQPTETPTPTPTFTPTPTSTPTREVMLQEGEALFEFADATNGELIRAAAPEEVMSILEAAGTEPGQVEEVELAVWSADGDILSLGGVPIFQKVDGDWNYNAALVYEENYINMGPALILPDTSSFTKPEPAEYPFWGGLLISNHSWGDSTVVIGQLVGGQYSEVVLLYEGKTFDTQRVYLEFKYLNPNSGRITSFWITKHHGIWVDNAEFSFHKLAQVSPKVSVSISTSRRSYPELWKKMHGTELGEFDISAIRAIVLQGGVVPSTEASINMTIHREP